MSDKQAGMIRRKLHWTSGEFDKSTVDKLLRLTDAMMLGIFDASQIIHHLFEIEAAGRRHWDEEEQLKRDRSKKEIIDILFAYD